MKGGIFIFTEEVAVVGNLAVNKSKMLNKRPLAYFIASMLAGMFVGIGISLTFCVGSMLNAGGFSGTKIVMGASFGIALSLVIMAGSELFTGNNFVMSVGIYQKKVSLADSIKLWVVCWIGNLVGSMLIGFLVYKSGVINPDFGEFLAKGVYGKITLPVVDLIIRGILCNMLVCLAVWCGLKMKSESGKLIMIFWCLFAFITLGLEHSVANMTLFTIGFLNPMSYDITILGCLYNLLFVTLGNMIGGIVLLAIPYSFIAKE